MGFVEGDPQSEERISPFGESPFRAEHESRYMFASHEVEGKRVLDVACGSGVGFPYLAERAATVVGCDVSAAALVQARRVDGRALLVQGSGTALPLSSESVDVVTSFETLEHLDNPAVFLAEVARVLVPDGTLLLSTPNGRFTQRDEKGRPSNPFHVDEYSTRELVSLAREQFDQVEVMGQRVSPRFGVCPYWDTLATRPGDPKGRLKAFLWKVLGRLWFSERLTRLVLRQPRFPSAEDFSFSVEDADRTLTVFLRAGLIEPRD